MSVCRSVIFVCTAFGLAAAPGYASGAKTAGAIPYAYEQVILPADSPAVIAEKAAKTLPRPNQSAWMRLEETFFIHFGPNTFRGVEWGDGHEKPDIFNPSALDAEQWIRTIKNAGGKMVILVAKHHDGMSLWPTRYSDHSVSASPWRGGKGDLVREVADAARKHGVKLGLYLSPADLWQLKTNADNPGGYYGDGSQKRLSAIPTDPASFKTDPSKGRSATPGFGRYTYKVDNYNRYFLNQLYEILTEYGPVDEVWFDGANPDPSVAQTYDYGAWYDLIRKLQPTAVIFGKGPDARWVGNEGGVGRVTEWSVIPLSAPPGEFHWPDMQDDDLGSRAKLVPGSHLWWYPAEVNTSILYGWFWAKGKRVKTAADLVDLYYNSVGRNGNMLLNLPPDTRGLIPDDQVASLRLASQVIADTFAKNLAQGGVLTSDSAAKAHPASLALDGRPQSWWEAGAGKTQAALVLQLPEARTFDVVALQEAVDKRGQRIEAFSIDIWDGARWVEKDTATTVGYKRILRWDVPVTTDRIRLRITKARFAPALAHLALYKQAELVRPPLVSDRTAQGMVTMSCPQSLQAVYTIDGSIPVPTSLVYKTPLTMARGGTVNAACLAADGRLGMIATKRFAALVPSGWKVVDAAGEESRQQAELAIDGDARSLWQGSSLPASLTVDMGKVEDIGGLTYTPRQDGKSEGIVDTFRFEISLDGKYWQTAIAQGRFGNIENNPVEQEIPITPVKARFFRFTALTAIKSGTGVSGAEIGVMAAPSASMSPVP